MGVDRSVVSEEVVPPDIRKKLVSGKGNVFILDQIEEKIVFFWRQLYFFAVHGYGTGGDIDFKPIEPMIFSTGFSTLLFLERTALTRAISSFGLKGFTT